MNISFYRYDSDWPTVQIVRREEAAEVLRELPENKKFFMASITSVGNDENYVKIYIFDKDKKRRLNSRKEDNWFKW